MAIKIGSLLIELAVEHGLLKSGLSKSEKEIQASVKRVEKMGRRITGFGKALSAGVTTPILAAGAAFGVAANRIAAESREIATAAQVAGEGFEDFQRQAFAAKTVGIEMDKLGDIFKDTRDRVGDFLATGGGPMADFFENIAPKVGVTAEAFKGLSGKDALQLYFDSLRKANVSQEEMVFYLEAMASDATNLIPLLENSGKAMDELGRNAAIVSEADKDQLEKYNQAQEKLAVSLQNLTVALINSGLLESMTSLVSTLADMTSELAETNPALLKIGVVAGGLVATVGPVVSAIGGLVTMFAKVPGVTAAAGVAFRALLGPVGAVITAAGILYSVWSNWDSIEPILRRLYEGARKWLQEKLGAVFEWVGRKVGEFTAYFHDSYMAIVGNSIIPDMVDGIAAEMARLDQVMVDPARRAAQSTQEAMREMAGKVQALLARLFPEIERARALASDRALIEGSNLSDDQKAEARFRLVGGREKPDVSVLADPVGELAKITEATGVFTDEIETAGRETQVQTVAIARSFADMARDVVSSLSNLARSIKSGGFLDILDGVFDVVMQLGSVGVFGQGFANNINRPRGFANGTAFAPGGLAMVGERGPELVQLPGGSRVIPNHELRQAANDGGAQVTIRLGEGLVADMMSKSAAQTVRIVEAVGPSLVQGASNVARRDAARPIMPGGVTG